MEVNRNMNDTLRRLARWLRDEPSGQFVTLWLICAGCAAAGYVAGRRDGGGE